MGKIDLTALYKDDKAFLKELKFLQKEVNRYSSYEGNLFQSGKYLYEFLKFDTDFSALFEKCYQYAHINSDLDLTDNKYQTYLGSIMNLYEKYGEKTSFVTPEILSHSYEEFTLLMKDFPKLKEYKRNIKSVFHSKKLIKSKEEEKLISILTTTYSKPEEISEFLTNTDLNYGDILDENGKKVHLTNSNYATYMESTHQDIRKEVFNHIYDAFKNHENTYASILATNVINDNRIAKIRNFKSACGLSLYHNEIPLKIYDNLISGVHQNLPRFYPFYDLKKDILGLDEIHLYDTFANITKDYDKKFTYEEARGIIVSSLGILGKDYTNILNQAFDENWLDCRILPNKRSGAYCTCAYLAHPYVVSSYEGKINDISTLAHELGHAMHYYYAQKNNTYQDYEYSIFVAEVASQVNEIILTEYLYKNSDNLEEKKYLLDLMLQRFKSTVIRQTMFAEYEKKIHDLEFSGQTLTKDVLVNSYNDLNKLYFGPNVKVDEKIKYECFRIPHFYYNFYVYQYATGYIAALKIARDIINGKPLALENYLKFLKLGSTKDPIKSLKVAGVDIMSLDIYDEVFKIFEEKLNLLRSLYE